MAKTLGRVSRCFILKVNMRFAAIGMAFGVVPMLTFGHLNLINVPI